MIDVAGTAGRLQDAHFSPLTILRALLTGCLGFGYRQSTCESNVYKIT